MGKLDGKVAFITGAARGQGRSHAVRLAQEGADVIAVDIAAQIASVPYPMATPDDLAATVAEVEALDRRIVARQADVRDRAALQAAFDAGVAELGGVDIVVANAGIAPLTTPEPEPARIAEKTEPVDSPAKDTEKETETASVKDSVSPDELPAAAPEPAPKPAARPSPAPKPRPPVVAAPARAKPAPPPPAPEPDVLDRILIHRIAIYAYHGVHAEEERLGQRFYVSLDCCLDLEAAGRDDDWSSTVCYGRLTEIVNSIATGRGTPTLPSSHRLTAERLTPIAFARSLWVR